ncbi:hypothetical protein [Shinella zoogloeoides]|uniref:hypothetical protein n=1 Tax=Shinella zoogloeoides TaxID=352475 RepID=UPI001F56E5BB|nr:hypothetical protein [Shinella zoogloeoides]
MPASRTDIAGWLAILAGSLVADTLDAADLANRTAVATDLEGEAFAAEVLSIMRVIAESVETPAGFDVVAVPVGFDADTLAAATILTAFGLGIAGPRVAWSSRPQARTARSRIAAHGEAALAAVAGMGAGAVDLYRYLSRIVEIAVLIVSDRAATAVPIVRVETGISLPSTVLAYHLYGDAARAQSLVEIARSTTPMLMPIGFDALES